LIFGEQTAQAGENACLRQQSSDRALRLFGAVQLSAVVIYFLGFGLGLYR
jgi:hypothetical protein